MNTIYKLLFSISILTLATHFASAQTANIIEGCVPLEVNFSPPAGQSAFFWDFKDGTAGSVEAAPSHIFSTPGVYEVSLNSGTGGSEVGTVTITVLPDIDIQINVTLIDPCNPRRFQFTNNSVVPTGITVTGYLWTFGDGSTSSQQNPIHFYAQPGLKSVSLEILTDIAGCNNSELFENFIDVSAEPVLNAFFTANPSATCDVPATVFFASGQTLAEVEYNWDFGDSESSTDPTSTIHQYTEEGVYEAELTLTKGDCVSTFTRTISIGAPLADFGFNDTMCIGVSTILTNNTAANIFQWIFPESVTLQTEDDVKEPMVIFNEAGLVTITMVGQLGGDADCIVDTTFQVFIQDPEVAVIIDPENTCINPTVVNITTTEPFASYVWFDVPDGMSYTATYETPPRDSFYVNTEDSVLIELVVTTFQGCVAVLDDYYSQQLPEAHFIPDVHHGCVPLEVTFQDTSTSYEPILTYSYDYGNGDSQTFTNNDDHTYVFNNPGEYLVTLIVENEAGCIDTSWAVLIEVGEQIMIEYELDQSEVCIGDNVTLNAINIDPRIDAFNLSTDDGRTHHCEGESTLVHAFNNNTGVFDIEYTVDYNGCRTIITDEDVITVNGPLADLWYMVNCDDPLAVMFSDSSQMGTSILWTIEDTSGVDVTYTDSDFTHIFPESGDYTVYLEVFNETTGCPSDIDSVVIHARELVATFDLPENLCDNTFYNLDASLSIDSDDDCTQQYTWSFQKNGRPRRVGDAIIQHIFPVEGIDVVTLTTVDVNGCTQAVTDTVDVFTIQPTFEFDKEPICFPSEVTFADMTTSDTTIVGWSYLEGALDLGNINEFSQDQNPSQTFNFFNLNLEELPIFLAVEDALGCRDTIQRNIDVYKPLTEISSDPEPICIGGEIEFVAIDITDQGSTLDYIWDFDNGQSSTDSTASIEYNISGTYNVILNIAEESTGCQNEQKVQILVTDPPVAAFSAEHEGVLLTPGDVICVPGTIDFQDNSNLNGNPVSYLWGAGAGGNSLNQNPTLTFPKGTHDVMMIVTSDYGCADTVFSNYTIVGAEGDFELSEDEICKGESITFNMIDTVGVGSWSWDFGFGEVFDNINPITQTIGEDVIGNSTIVTLSLLSEGIACEVVVTQEIFFNNNGDQLILDTITVQKGLDAQFDIISDAINSDFLVLIESPIPLVCEDCFPPVASSNTDSCFTYVLEYTDADNCDFIRYEITVLPVPTVIAVPNLFTPNGDDMNEFFRIVEKIDTIKGQGILEYEEFRVYNRWGETVYDNTNGLTGWDGTRDGEQVPPEVYGYYMVVRLVGDIPNDPDRRNIRVFKGDVTLLR